MTGKRFIQKLKLTNFLSYGIMEKEIELGPLNVLIGPNTSGKSNLLEVFSILQALPKDITSPISEGGGVSEWIWKGHTKNRKASIEAIIFYPFGKMPLRYKIDFGISGQRFELLDEYVENEKADHGESDTYFYYRYNNGYPSINKITNPEEEIVEARKSTLKRIPADDFLFNQSIIAQRQDPDIYPVITYLGKNFSKIRMYREWNLGRDTPPRRPQNADLPEDFLFEDASNLGLVLNDLQHKNEAKSLILKGLKKFCTEIEDISTKIHAGTVQIHLHEKGLKEPIPATRLSDGTIRYLCLLVILCHPTPPPVVCLEEPELGLHPDIIPYITELLVDASQRTQLFVTTHSDTLISALSEHPEFVMVCGKDENGSQLRRLEKDQLQEWLKKYKLGELWRMGEIGGNKW